MDDTVYDSGSNDDQINPMTRLAYLLSQQQYLLKLPTIYLTPINLSTPPQHA